VSAAVALRGHGTHKKLQFALHKSFLHLCKPGLKKSIKAIKEKTSIAGKLGMA